MSNKYNTTDLDPQTTFERHVFHRDQFAHYLRWTYILKEAQVNDRVCDFGCGQGNLLEVLYRNRFKCQLYVGFDIRKQTIEKAKEKFKAVPWAHFFTCDLITVTYDFSQVKADKVCSFEVLEHVGKQNVPTFLQRFKDCGKADATYYLSTPNYDPVVGAAGNHTYDSGDGRGLAVHEWDHQELQQAILVAGFKVVKKFGTFASQKDYIKLLSPAQREVFDQLKEYYDANLMANIFAPMFPEQARNTMWVLKREEVL
jgi:2-polyprenyl-3-methyl-5-hydroxy-6-metoxy-1,4-benzoquinol methylase